MLTNGTTPAFRPANADGRRPLDDHHFAACDAHAYPLSIWSAIVHPGLRHEAALAGCLRGTLDLGLGAGPLSLACLSLAGPATPPGERTREGDDYVLTTPLAGAYLAVRLGEAGTMRFGYAASPALMARLRLEEPHVPGGPCPGRGATPTGRALSEALGATLAAIRDAMSGGTAAARPAVAA